MTAPPAREPSWKITVTDKATGDRFLKQFTDLEAGVKWAARFFASGPLSIFVEQEPGREEPAVRMIRCQYEQSDQMMIELGDPTVGFADGWAEVPEDLHKRYTRAREEFLVALGELDTVIHAADREEQRAHRLDEIIEGKDGPFLLEKGDPLWTRLIFATGCGPELGTDATTIRCEKAPPAGSEERWTLKVLKVLERESE